MSEAGDGAPDSRAPPGTKAGRNEQRKLRATLLNNIAVGFFLAAVLQPGLALIQQSRPVTLAEAGGSLILFMAAAAFATAGRWVAGRLED